MVKSHTSRAQNLFENIVIVAIVLVLVQTFTEDLAVALGWGWDVRRVLLILGFVFDLFFTAEFLVRSYESIINRSFLDYFWYRRGWIDFVASVPLLLLNSGPIVFSMLAGGVTVIGIGGMLNVLKVVKAIRIARILRLLRVLKIFRKIKNTDSTMAQRHVAKITGIAVSSFVFGLLALTVLLSFTNLPSLDQEIRQVNLDSLAYIEDQNLASPAQTGRLEAFAEVNSAILVVREDGQTRYTRHGNEFYSRFFGPMDYDHQERGDIEVFFDVRPINAQQARDSLIYFAIIVGMVVAFLVYYSAHFAITVSDPIHVMLRGYREKDYNLEVKSPRHFRDDEVYELAREYNQVFLPMKDRQAHENGDNQASNIKLDDFSDLLG